MCGDRRKRPSVCILIGLVLCMVWVGFTGVGCRTEIPGRPKAKAFNPGKGPVNSIRLFTLPMLFNLDGEPGPDAFKARVYAIRDSAPKPVPITHGTLKLFFLTGVQTVISRFLHASPGHFQERIWIAIGSRQASAFTTILPWRSISPSHCPARCQFRRSSLR